MSPPHLVLAASDWWSLFGHFVSLSLLAVGGAISTAPDMQRYLVGQQGWLSDAQFTSSIALAQAAPGPNVLFVALMGWNVGLNCGSYAAALLGMSIAMAGILIPSTTLTYLVTSWGHRNREMRAVRAFKAGLAPIVVGLLMATGWLLTVVHGNAIEHWPLWLVTGASTLLVWRTRIHLLWLLGAGAVVGALGWI